MLQKNINSTNGKNKITHTRKKTKFTKNKKIKNAQTFRQLNMNESPIGGLIDIENYIFFIFTVHFGVYCIVHKFTYI